MVKSIFIIFLSTLCAFAQPRAFTFSDPAGIPAIAPAASGPTNDTYGLVGWWTFDENTGTTAGDSSGNGNTGTLSGSPIPTWTSGIITNALSFAGGYVDLGSSSTLRPTSALTLMCWINISTLSFFNCFMSTGEDFNKGLHGVTFWLYADGSLELEWANDSTYGQLNGPTPLPSATWIHVAATLDGSTVNLYTNGVLYATRGQPFTPTAGSVDALIGIAYNSTTPAYPFSGTIDDVRIYNRALSAAEIHTQYEWPTGGRP
jgi:hypothetical protein